MFKSVFPGSPGTEEKAMPCSCWGSCLARCEPACNEEGSYFMSDWLDEAAEYGGDDIMH